MSDPMSCDWRLRVAVDTRTGVSLVQAHRTHGTRYASDLPTPVPASIIRCSRALNACATERAMSIWPGRSSYPGISPRVPPRRRCAATDSSSSLAQSSCAGRWRADCGSRVSGRKLAQPGSSMNWAGVIMPERAAAASLVVEEVVYRLVVVRAADRLADERRD